jgi:SecY interacting protein Syd
MVSPTTKALNILFNQFIVSYRQEHGELPSVAWDEAWPSPCVVDKKVSDAALCYWQPYKRDGSGSFANVAAALALPIHESVADYYGSFFCESLTANFQGSKFSLLQVWNEEDFQGLQENIIGHLLMKKRLGQRPTVFIGCIDDDTIISVENSTGEVVVEQVGCEPHKVLADSLPLFLEQLTLSWDPV